MSAAIGPAPRPAGRLIAGLGLGQIVSWGTLYYTFPVVAEPMAAELGIGRAGAYGGVTLGLLVAALAAYPVGAAIDRGRGRAVMALGSLLGGLMLLAWSQAAGPWTLYAALAGIGLAQAMTLYDPAFAVVARRFGAEARRGITTLTLWGGFASTVFVPVAQILLDQLGWRGALAALGLLNLGLCVALHLAVIDRAPPPDPARATPPPQGTGAVRRAARRPAFWGLALAFTFQAGTISALAFHLYPLLVEQGYATATVVAAIAVVGPAQVAGRILVGTAMRRSSVRSLGLAAAFALPASLALLLFLPPGFASLAAFAVVYGAGNGVMTIVRGLAVPEMLSREAYGAINGALALPATAAKALAPAAAALLWGAAGGYGAVLAAALAAALLMAAAFAFAASRRDVHQV